MLARTKSNKKEAPYPGKISDELLAKTTRKKFAWMWYFARIFIPGWNETEREFKYIVTVSSVASSKRFLDFFLLRTHYDSNRRNDIFLCVFRKLHMVYRACVVQSVTLVFILSLFEEIIMYTRQYNFILHSLHGFSETNYNVYTATWQIYAIWLAESRGISD